MRVETLFDVLDSDFYTGVCGFTITGIMQFSDR